LARDEGLVVDSIGDELLVYDTACSRAHSLNAVAAAVWRACDGRRDVDQLAVFTGFDRSAVELALNNLHDVELITGYQSSGVSRRVVLRRLSLTAAGLAVGLPVIRSITAPTAAMAVSGGCTSNAGCAGGSYCGSLNHCSRSSSGRPRKEHSACFLGLNSCTDGSICTTNGDVGSCVPKN
jgi:hypothetical protein